MEEEQIQIENAADGIITEFIVSRKGLPINNIVELITITATIASNASTLEHADFKHMHKKEQMDLAMFLIKDIYEKIILAELISLENKLVLDKLMDDEKDLREKVKDAIEVYNMTAQIAGLPSFNKIEKSGVKALTSGLKKLKF